MFFSFHLFILLIKIINDQHFFMLIYIFNYLFRVFHVHFACNLFSTIFVLCFVPFTLSFIRHYNQLMHIMSFYFSYSFSFTMVRSLIAEELFFCFNFSSRGSNTNISDCIAGFIQACCSLLSIFLPIFLIKIID